MPTSYQSGGARVNPPKSPTPSGDPPALTKRDLPRDTATFVPYYWEAYNEMVQPRRFDWYLIRRWLKDLGPLGFTIVKTLRNRCYHNPLQGVLRDECEVDMNELAAEIGVGRATLFREFKTNKMLEHFVRRQRQYAIKDGRWFKDANVYQVCMDDPIHPDDMAAYDDLRAIKEAERAAFEAERQQQEQNGKPPPPRVKNHGNSGTDAPAPASQTSDDLPKSQNETYGSDMENEGEIGKSQNETYDDDDEIRKSQIATTLMSSQIATTPMSSQIATSLVDLPSGGLLSKDSLTRMGAAPVINNAPKGGEEPEKKPPPLFQLWHKVLPALEAKMTTPTFHTHIESLVPVSMAPTGSGGVEVVLNCPSAFTREWLEKRHVPAIEAALGTEMECAVAVRLVQLPKEGSYA